MVNSESKKKLDMMLRDPLNSAHPNDLDRFFDSVLTCLVSGVTVDEANEYIEENTRKFNPNDVFDAQCRFELCYKAMSYAIIKQYTSRKDQKNET